MQAATVKKDSFMQGRTQAEDSIRTILYVKPGT
jgi:hypothetical protein